MTANYKHQALYNGDVENAELVRVDLYNQIPDAGEERTMTEQDWDGIYSISDERVTAVATAANVSEERVSDICTSDWTEGEEHQNWLNNAPVEEIADWVAVIARDQDAMEASAND